MTPQPPADIADFLAQLRDRLPDATVAVDAPGAAAGEWWLDVEAPDLRATLSWRQDRGFGVFTGEPGYGDRPDELYRHPDLAADRVRQLAEAGGRDEAPQPMQLRDLRSLLGVPQAQLADRMRVRQASVSKFETRRDAKLSTLAAYVSGLGGRVEMRVVFDGFEAVIAVPAADPAETDAETS